MFGITGDPKILISDGFTPVSVRVFGFGLSVVECRVSVRSGELRSGQLGPSEWCTLRWIIE